MKSPFVLIFSLVFVSALPALEMLSACSVASAPSPQEIGTLSIPLTAQGSRGSTFVLDAQFALTGPETMTLDAGGGATALTQVVSAGSYVSELLSGWQLQRQAPDMSLVPVQATLQHSATLAFEIRSNQLTRLSYQFLVDGEVVDFGPGTLEIGIEVDEAAPSNEATCDDGTATGSESDIDCGGECTPCDQGSHCDTDADCQLGSCAFGICGTPISAGVIAGDLTLVPDDSPYVLEGTLQVGGDLSVTAGSELFGRAQAVEVHGSLSVAGTTSEPVVFHDLRIDPRGTDEAPIQIEIIHAFFDGGSPYPSSGAVYGSLVLTDSVLTDTESLYLWYPVAESNILRNVFIRAGGISVGTRGIPVNVDDNYFLEQTTDYAVTNWASYSGTYLQVHGNTFASTDRPALTLPPGYDSAAMDATGNYFGTTDPALIASMIVDRNDDLNVVNFIPFEPFIDAPTPETPLPPMVP